MRLALQLIYYHSQLYSIDTALYMNTCIKSKKILKWWLIANWCMDFYEGNCSEICFGDLRGLILLPWQQIHHFKVHNWKVQDFYFQNIYGLHYQKLSRKCRNFNLKFVQQFSSKMWKVLVVKGLKSSNKSKTLCLVFLQRMPRSVASSHSITYCT